MIAHEHLSLAEIEPRVFDITSHELGIAREKLTPNTRIIEDLGADSLEAVELLMAVEDEFHITLADPDQNLVYKTVFTRAGFCLADLAELVYLQQGSGAPKHDFWGWTKIPASASPSLPFTQLDGVWRPQTLKRWELLEPLAKGRRVEQYRRRSDGMRCVLLPSAAVEIGCDVSDGLPDERPLHVAELDSFLIDAEPVSTTAYCRFLNSIGEVAPEMLADWFVLEAHDDRNEHVLLQRVKKTWRPVPGSERWPMMLVSWYGANAYARWANGQDWISYREEIEEDRESFLPTEAQWEYAARGPRYQSFPWGETPPAPEQMCYGQHRRGMTYRVETLPLADVNEQRGMSPFGLHHMAGNVWQWCRDWYDQHFYQRPDARRPNPVNRASTQVRSERGGSWIGPAELCRSSYRRGRPPLARGRCLGFRCISRA